MNLISVLHEDPELARQLEPGQFRAASRRAAAKVISLPKGDAVPAEWSPREPGSLGMLVLSGLLLRGVAVESRPTVEVLGTGDLVRPFEPEHDPYAMVPVGVRWWVLRPARLAVLDADFTRRMSAYPEVIAELAGRLWRRSSASSLRLALVQQPSLSARLHFTLWHLADRFGWVESDGVALPVPLCHSLLSWLVGARRPAVSRALIELERAGSISRRSDATWLLAGQPPEGLGARTASAQEIAA